MERVKNCILIIDLENHEIYWKKKFFGEIEKIWLSNDLKEFKKSDLESFVEDFNELPGSYQNKKFKIFELLVMKRYPELYI